MTYYPVIIVLILAILDWIAMEKNSKVLEYIAKPATMLALLGWIWMNTGFDGPMLWFTLGLIFCLAGDVFLMLPWNLFIYGLASFLLGHILFIVGLMNQAPYINLLGGVLIVLLGIFLLWLYPKLVDGLKAKGQDRLKIPVLIYSMVISLMVYSAVMTWTRSGWSSTAALFVSVGAVLFYASDSINAWIRFLNPISHGRLKVMVTYHLGLIGIILGAMLHSVSS